MKYLVIIANLIMCIIAFNNTFKQSIKNGHVLIYTLISLGFGILTYESVVNNQMISYGRIIMCLVLLLNLKFNIIETTKIFYIMTFVFHFSLITKQPYLNLIGFILGSIIYINEGYLLFNTPNKTFMDSSKLFACILFAIHHISSISPITLMSLLK